MEDTLREFGNVLKIILLSVLILVLMEDTLREDKVCNKEDGFPSLNPCFNRRYAQSSFVNTTGDYVATLS